MTPTHFHNAALDILRNYWRIKAASGLYALFPEIAEDPLEYTNMPAVGLAKSFLTTEPGADAMSALQDFVLLRLPRDLLLALIAQFEGRLVARLSALGESTTGTLGERQRRIESKLPLPVSLIQDLDEVRWRRNAMIHNDDKADAKYVTACGLVLPRAQSYVKPVAVGDNVSPDPPYLTYATDALVRYSSAIG